MKIFLKQPEPLDLTQSKIETTDPLVSAYYKACFYDVVPRIENGEIVYTINIDKTKSRYSKEKIEHTQSVLMNFIEFYNGHRELTDLALEIKRSKAPLAKGGKS